jgi:iron(II)-dependent oxidoreductase
MSLMTLLKSHNLDCNQTIGELAKHPCRDPCAERMLRAGRYCKLLTASKGSWEGDAISAATNTLEREMAFVPSGVTQIRSIEVTDIPVNAKSSSAFIESTEETFFIDRFAVTNGQFERFLLEDGYRQEKYWPEDILPLVFQFVDQSNRAGPSFWSSGRPPEHLTDHPVVGISWYEANAYAMWAGKRLPTSGQWQRSGTWWKPNVRYPWGDGFELGRANTSTSSMQKTLGVREFAAGATPNGIFQLIGNVWEWVYASIEEIYLDGAPASILEPLGEIRGGAFDTYLPSQASCLYRSGRPLLSRNENVGFRCCVPTSDLQSVVTSTNAVGGAP